jgi:predicted secreted protein
MDGRMHFILKINDMNRLVIISIFLIVSACNEDSINTIDISDSDSIKKWTELQFNEFKECCADEDNLEYMQQKLLNISTKRVRGIKFILSDETLKMKGIIEVADIYSENNFNYTLIFRYSKDSTISIRYNYVNEKWERVEIYQNRLDEICDCTIDREPKTCCPYSFGHNPEISSYTKLKVIDGFLFKIKKTCIYLE